MPISRPSRCCWRSAAGWILGDALPGLAWAGIFIATAGVIWAALPEDKGLAAFRGEDAAGGLRRAQRRAVRPFLAGVPRGDPHARRRKPVDGCAACDDVRPDRCNRRCCSAGCGLQDRKAIGATFRAVEAQPRARASPAWSRPSCWFTGFALTRGGQCPHARLDRNAAGGVPQPPGFGQASRPRANGPACRWWCWGSRRCCSPRFDGVQVAGSKRAALRRARMRKCSLIGLLGWWRWPAGMFASPWMAMDTLRDAARENDREALEQNIDFPALRASVKAEMYGQIEAEARRRGDNRRARQHRVELCQGLRRWHGRCGDHSRRDVGDAGHRQPDPPRAGHRSGEGNRLARPLGQLRHLRAVPEGKDGKVHPSLMFKRNGVVVEACGDRHSGRLRRRFGVGVVFPAPFSFGSLILPHPPPLCMFFQTLDRGPSKDG